MDPGPGGRRRRDHCFFVGWLADILGHLSPVKRAFMDSPVAVSPRPEHIMEFYSDDDKLLDGWESLISNAVETGDTAICVATKAHAYGLAERLKLHTPKVAGTSGQGRYITGDAAGALSAVQPAAKLQQDP